MRKQLVIAALVITLVVAGITTTAAFAAQAFANALSATDGAPNATSVASVPEGSASSSPSPSPYRALTPAYIAHTLQPGEPLITDEQINDYYLAQSPAILGDLANTMLAIREGQLEVRCMADKGWWYDPRYRAGLESGSPADLALNGNTGAGDAYRWQDAGCYGFAVHQTGAGN